MYKLSAEPSELKYLESAALAGNLEEVEYLTRYRPNQSTDHYKILKKTIISGQIETAKLLINRGCQLSEKENEFFSPNSSLSSEDGYSVKSKCLFDEKDNTLLHSAVAVGSLELVKLLVLKDLSADIPDQDGIPLFFKVVDSPFNELQTTALLDYLLDNEDDIFTRCEGSGFTILHYAIEKQNSSIIPLLLKRNCNINAKSKDGSTSLHLAVKNGNSEIVELLLDNAANDKVFNVNYLTPLCLAIQIGDFNIFRILCEFSRRFEIFRKQRALHMAIEKGNLEIINTLVNGELDFVKGDSESVTYRYMACPKENLSIFSALLNMKQHDKLNTGLTALNLAVKVNNSEVVALLLEKSADCKAVDGNNKTPLSFALENTNGDAQILEILLNHIRQVESAKNDYFVTGEEQVLKEYYFKAREDKSGNSALHLAVEQKNEIAVSLLLKHKSCIDTLNQNGHTPFDLAIINGSLSMVNIFLQSQHDLEALFVPKKLDGYTPMHFAVETENKDILKLLFKARISPDISKPKELTPLHIAVRRNNKDIIKLLLKNGAKVDVCGRYDFETPLFTAAEFGCTEAIEILLEVSSSWSSKCKEAYLLMCIAAHNGHEKVVQMLLDLGVDPNENVDKYLTPLHAAAQNGNEGIVKLLLEHGVHVDLVRKGCQLISTPLLAAAYAGSSKTVKLLLDYGADLNVKLENLSENANSESYEIWLSNNSFSSSEDGADSMMKFINLIKEPVLEDQELVPNTQQILIQGNYKDSEIGNERLEGLLLGSTALHLAVKSGNEEMVKLLIDCGAAVNSTTKYGATPLGLAFEKGDKAIIKHLLSSGVDINIPHKCRSIFHIESLRKNFIITEMLFEYISSQNQFNKNSYIKSLQNAIEGKYEVMVEKMLEARPNLLIEHKEEPWLHFAVRNKNLEIIKMLLKYGADVNVCYEEDATALHVAASINEPEIVMLLLDASVDIDLNFKDDHPIKEAIGVGNVEIVEIFLKRGLNDYIFKKSFFYAISQGNANCSKKQIVQKYLDFGASIDMENEDGKFPLSIAVKEECLALVRLFLREDATLKIIANTGKTILNFEILEASFSFDQREKLKIIQLLIENYIGINTQDETGYLPIDTLFKAKYYTGPSKERMIRSCLLNLFLLNGTDPNHVNKETGKTLLMSAIETNDSECVKLLILNGADINNINKYKQGLLKFTRHTAQIYIDGNVDDKKTKSYVEQSRSIISLLKQEIARLLFFNKHVNETYTCKENGNSYKKYLKELKLMKLTEICKGVSYIDILKANYSKLVSLCANKFVNLVLMPEAEVHKLFPIYAAILVGRIEIGSNRKRLLNSSYSSLEKVVGYKFPYSIVDYIFSFLSNRDLKNINKAINNEIF